jgi:hypothetical protein
MSEKNNVKPEAFWSHLRATWVPGFENLLDYGLDNGIYDPNEPLERCVLYTLFYPKLLSSFIFYRLVFLWIALPYFQAELDAQTQTFNATKRRADKHKVIPHGIPDLIAAKPEKHGTQDYKVFHFFSRPPHILKVTGTSCWSIQLSLMRWRTAGHHPPMMSLRRSQ